VGLIDSISPGVLAASEPLLMTGALAHRALGNASKAREYLETLVSRNGRNNTAQGMLASIYVEAKDYSRALSVLEGLQRVAPDDPHTLFLLGTVQMARKRYAQANELFEKAAARGGSADAIRELGFSQLSQGQDKSGITNIEKAFAANPADARAGVQLAMIYMRQGQPAKALQTVDAMLKRDPGNLVLINFQGNMLGRSGDKRGAREAFQRVLAKDPGFRAASVNLAWLDLEEKRFDAARARLSEMLKATKDDPDVLYQLGVVEMRADRPDEALRHWQRADEVQANNPSPGLAIVDLYSRQKQTDKAMAAAKLLASKYTGNLVVQLALARAYTASGELSGARQALQEATKLAEFDASKQTLIGRMQLEAGNPDGAAYNAQKALQAMADDVGAMALQVEVESARGDMPKAEAAMKALIAKHPNSASALVLQANLAMSRGQFPVAVANYQAVMDKEPGTAVAILLARALMASGDSAKAVNALSAWTRKRPDDRVAVRALAEVQLSAGQNEAARKSYTQLLAAEPNDPSTLSAYAVLLQRLGDPAAVGIAEKAMKLAPGAAQYVDTLGWILVQRGDLEGGLRHLRDARLRSPGSGDIRYHLAFALAKSGRKPEAKTELAAALSGAAKLQVTPEVRKLMTELDL
jgi:putative PEP-CTERM system TPR-repeat lipoprotein